ncbi:hypothetical protein Q1695_012481 [Nippostrongylus brasiliensis]|nr:hypothetical protein Q1695_012481 [Nippostrongylus brasiliensis]
MEETRVDQLIIGYAESVGDRFAATGSVSLVRTPEVNILVDCGDPWNGDELLEKLSSCGLQKDEVSRNIPWEMHKYLLLCSLMNSTKVTKFSCRSRSTDNLIGIVVVTHGHVDHCGNLSLFKDATHYLGRDIAVRGEYSTLSEDDPVLLAPNIELRRCSGHTDHDLIVVVNNAERGCVVIAGDIFESQNDEDLWRDVSRYPAQQLKSRSVIKGIADWIVPGHGPMFKNEKMETVDKL